MEKLENNDEVLNNQTGLVDDDEASKEIVSLINDFRFTFLEEFKESHTLKEALYRQGSTHYGDEFKEDKYCPFVQFKMFLDFIDKNKLDISNIRVAYGKANYLLGQPSTIAIFCMVFDRDAMLSYKNYGIMFNIVFKSWAPEFKLGEFTFLDYDVYTTIKDIMESDEDLCIPPKFDMRIWADSIEIRRIVKYCSPFKDEIRFVDTPY